MISKDCESFINKSWAECIIWGKADCKDCKSYKPDPNKSNKEVVKFD